jgi:hypothetical protein
MDKRQCTTADGNGNKCPFYGGFLMVACVRQGTGIDHLTAKTGAKKYFCS